METKTKEDKPKIIKCDRCNAGYVVVDGYYELPCPACKGKGYILTLEKADYKQLIHDANNYLSGGGCGAASVQQAAKRYREMIKK